MSSQLLPSVMKESDNFVCNLVKLSQCNRRKNKPAPSAKLAFTARNKKHYDSDDTLASTEPGDMSNNEFSDKSYMTDGSSRRVAKTSVRIVNKSVVRPPPGLTAPPGLTRPRTAPASVPFWKQPDTRLDAGAQCFVPSMATMQSNLNPESPCFVPSLGTVDAPSAMKSSLRNPMPSKGKVRCLSSKAEVAEGANASLCLADLIDTSASEISPLAGRMWQLSQDAKGTFEVQKALDGCSNEEERAELVAKLHGHAFQAAQCPHANHVLRKVITLMPPSALNFIVAELMSQGSHAIIEVARHRFGCRIIAGLIAYCSFEQMHGMVETLLADASALCMHEYGHFVMQRLLEQSSCISRGQLFQVMHARLVAMGTNFYGSKVVVKAMTYGTDTERSLLARAILQVDGLHGKYNLPCNASCLLAAIAKFRHGKNILELVLPVLEDVEKAHAVKQLAGLPLKTPKTRRHF